MATKGIVYLIRESGGLVKIGHTNNLDRRLKALSPVSSSELEILHTIETDKVVQVETNLHAYFSGKRLWRELFDLSSADIELVRKMDFDEYGRIILPENRRCFSEGSESHVRFDSGEPVTLELWEREPEGACLVYNGRVLTHHEIDMLIKDLRVFYGTIEHEQIIEWNSNATWRKDICRRGADVRIITATEEEIEAILNEVHCGAGK